MNDNDRDWEQHELRILIAHHRQQADEQAALAKLFEDSDDEDDQRFVIEVLVFVAKRKQRADELERRLHMRQAQPA